MSEDWDKEFEFEPTVKTTSVTSNSYNPKFELDKFTESDIQESALVGVVADPKNKE